jgi:hypothetical protein
MADATAQATDKAQEVAGQAREKAQEAADQATGRVRAELDQRSTEAGRQVGSTAGDLRSVGEELRRQGKDTPARLAEQAAERTERLGNYLSESDSDRILSDVEDFARRQPWAVVAGGLALGFAASRLLKASSRERYERRTAPSEAATIPPPPSPAPPVSTPAAHVPPMPPPGNGGAVVPPYAAPVPR